MSEVAALYVPNINPPPPPTGIGFNHMLSGSGGPVSSLGANGDGYTNLTTGDFYNKSNGVWVLQSGGGGSGVQQLFEVDADPVDPPTDPSRTALAFNRFTGYGWRWVVADQAWT